MPWQHSHCWHDCSALRSLANRCGPTGHWRGEAFFLHTPRRWRLRRFGTGEGADVPTGWEITLDLIRRLAVARGIEEQPDWAAWYRKEAGSEPNYSTVLAELTLSPAERRAILNGYIEPAEQDRQEGRRVPTAAHQAIAMLVQRGHIRVIVTTNFDRSLRTRCARRALSPQSLRRLMRCPAPNQSHTAPAIS
jgi:hypothetical protein